MQATTDLLGSVGGLGRFLFSHHGALLCVAKRLTGNRFRK
jgi:hypothetical protein